MRSRALYYSMTSKAEIQQKIDDYVSSIKQNSKKYPPYALGISAFAAGVVSIAVARKIHVRYFQRIQNSDWITPDVFERKRWVKGVVTRCAILCQWLP